MRRIRVAQIGCGCQHSGKIMKCMLEHSDRFEIVGLVDIDGYSSDPDFNGIPRLTEEEIFTMERLDAIVVEPEEHYLLETARRCIDRGFPIHMDKPAGESYEPFRSMMAEAKKKNLPVHLGYMYRTNPAVRYCLEQVRAGTLGKIIAIDTAMSTGHPDNFKEWLGTFQAGTMYILGCHMIDLIMTIMGCLPQRIHPFLKKTGFHDIDVYDNNFALLEYPDALCTVRINSSEVNGWARRHLVVNGEKGSIEIMPIEGDIRCSMTLQEDVITPFGESPRRHPLSLTKKGRYDDMMEEFAAIVCGEIDNPWTYEYEVSLHRAHIIACGLQNLDLNDMDRFF